MRAEKVISYLLNNDSGVTTLVDEKIWGGAAKKGAKPPLLVYAKQGATRAPDLDATQAVVTALIDVLCVARTYPELKELTEAVRIALSYQFGTIAGVEVVETQPSDEGPDEYDVDLEEHSNVFTFVVVHTE